MKEKETKREEAVVSLGVPLGLPVRLLAPCQHLTLFPVDFCIGTFRVAHWKSTTRATKSIS